MLNSRANVPPTQWPTVTLQRRRLHNPQRHHKYGSAVRMHTYVPPTSSISSTTSHSSSSPTWRPKTNSPPSSETVNLKDFHLFKFIISRCRATGCWFYISTPPTYSMAHVHVVHVHTALINTGSTDWQTQTSSGKLLLWFKESYWKFSLESMPYMPHPLLNNQCNMIVMLFHFCWSYSLL